MGARHPKGDYDALVTVEDGDSTNTRQSWIRVQLDAPKSIPSRILTANRGERSEGHSWRPVFKLFLLCLLVAGSLWALCWELEVDALSLLKQWWLPLVIIVSVGLLTIGAGMISPRFYANRSTKEALLNSIGKIQVLVRFIFPVFMFYGDFISDIGMMRRFWLQEDYAFAIMNGLAILAGSISSVVLGVHDFSEDSLLLTVMIFLQLTPLAVVVQSIGLFCAAIDGSGTDPRHKSLDGYLRDQVSSLLASATAGEAFTEALLSIFVQTYAILRQDISWTPLTITSVLFSIGSIVKSFSNLDKRGHVSRTIEDQGIVVGLAEMQSASFLLTVGYRLAEVSSQILFFPLFQLIVDDAQIYGLRYSGVLLWFVDCLVQAALVYCNTRNWKKVVYAVPNTIGTFEPMLLVGTDGGAVLSTPARLHVVSHLVELVLATVFVRIFYTERLDVVMEQQSRILLYFAVCNGVRYVLFLFLQKFCSHTATCSRDFPLQMILSDEAISMADDADRRVPVEVAALATFSLKGTNHQKIFKVLDSREVEAKHAYIAGNVCHLISRASQGKRPQQKEKLVQLGAGEAVLRAMQEYIDEEDDCPVLRGSCRAVYNLASGSLKNKIFFSETGPSMLLSCMLKKDKALRKYACFALEVLASNEEIRGKLASEMLGTDIVEAVLSNFAEDRNRKDALLQTAACGLIAKLAANDQLRQRFLKRDPPCTEEVLASMREHPNDADVQRNACFALRCLVPCCDRDRLAHNQLLSMGVRDHIRQAMDHHASQPSFQYEAWSLLRTLDGKNRLGLAGAPSGELEGRGRLSTSSADLWPLQPLTSRGVA